MSLSLNLRNLENENVALKGEISAKDLGIEGVDELIHTPQPLTYQLEAHKMEDGILLQGRLSVSVECECARCLKRFSHLIELPDWACHIPLEGDDKAAVDNESVDLTPYLREDILFGFPQHPLCKEDCGGLPKGLLNRPETSSGVSQKAETSSVWSELNKLKF